MKNKLKDPKKEKNKRIKDSRGKGLIMFTKEDIKKYSRKKK